METSLRLKKCKPYPDGFGRNLRRLFSFSYAQDRRGFGMNERAESFAAAARRKKTLPEASPVGFGFGMGAPGLVHRRIGQAQHDPPDHAQVRPAAELVGGALIELRIDEAFHQGSTIRASQRAVCWGEVKTRTWR